MTDRQFSRAYVLERCMSDSLAIITGLCSKVFYEGQTSSSHRAYVIVHSMSGRLAVRTALCSRAVFSGSLAVLTGL